MRLQDRSVFWVMLTVSLAWLLFPGWLFAAGQFPRGTGNYFSIPKLLATFAFYLIWMRTCWWVDTDARIQRLPVRWWNAGMFGVGFLGLLLVWIVPWFIASLSVA